MNDEIVEKKCTGTCGRTLPATPEYFYKSKVNRDGWYSWCKDCKNAYERDKVRGGKNGDEDCLTVTQLSKRAGVTRDVIKGLITHGTIQAFKVPSKYRPKEGEYRIKSEDAEAYISVITAKVSDATIITDESLLEIGNTSSNEDAAPVIGTPDQCGACGTARGNILGDVDDLSHVKYGYLCTRCLRIVHDFRSDVTRIRNVLKYLEQSRPGQI